MIEKHFFLLSWKFRNLWSKRGEVVKVKILPVQWVSSKYLWLFYFPGGFGDLQILRNCRISARKIKVVKEAFLISILQSLQGYSARLFTRLAHSPSFTRFPFPLPQSGMIHLFTTVCDCHTREHFIHSILPRTITPIDVMVLKIV